MTEEEMLREIARLQAENKRLENKNIKLHAEIQSRLAKAFDENPEVFKIIAPDESKKS